jgi:hypothetical protein
MTFDHQSKDKSETVKCCEKLVIPFMKETRSKVLFFDCPNVYHNDGVDKLFEEHRLEVYLSSGCGHGIEDGYPPNSHETMPNEQMHNDLKEVRQKMEKSRRNTTTLHHVVKESAAEFPKEKVQQ